MPAISGTAKTMKRTGSQRINVPSAQVYAAVHCPTDGRVKTVAAMTGRARIELVPYDPAWPGAFERASAEIAAVLGTSLQAIHHIGSTAVPGSITKGDLDIQVRVSATHFAHADATLGTHYRRNLASTHTETFSSFKDDEADPPLGIQLTIANSPDDFFCTVRDYFIANADVNERYNNLKREFEGATMDDYRTAKSAFLESLIKQLQTNVA